VSVPGALLRVDGLVYQPPRRRRWRDGQAHRDVDRIPERSHSGAAGHRIPLGIRDRAGRSVVTLAHG
jgi:hypothetical protein